MLRSKAPYLLFVLAGFWLGCAAQNARSFEKRAERLLAQAQAEKPDAPATKEAAVKFTSAKRFQSSARYDRADEAFRDSIDSSEKALGLADSVAVAEEAKAPEPAPKIEIAPTVPQPIIGKPEFSKSEPTKAEAPTTKRGMPAKALAKYLASKHALAENLTNSKPKPAEEKPAKVPAPKTEAPAKEAEVPATKAEVKEEPPHEERLQAEQVEPAPAAPEAIPAEALAKTEVAPKVISQRPKDSKIPGTGGEGLAVEGGEIAAKTAKAGAPSVQTKIVEAPSTKTLKRAPEKKRESVEEKFAEAPKEPAQQKASMKGLSKRRIPGSIDFKVNDPSIQGDAMSNLDQTSKFLLDNPSTTLILQGISASGELTNLVDSRFESIRSYLTAKGVPDDQIRLDPERKSGKSPVFELFLIEH